MIKRLLSRFKAPLIIQLDQMRAKAENDRVTYARLEADFLALQDDNVNLMKCNRLHRKQIDVSQEQIELLLTANAESHAGLLVIKNKAGQLEQELNVHKHLLNNARRLYPGQKYYNPQNHKDVTIWVCAAFNDWYMIRQQNEIRPSVLSKAEFESTYPGYIQMPAMNANRKNIV